ncbi:MAG: hypothetical protein QXQ04_09290 [Candidatus Bathyarchaeia archaeon]
MMGCKGIEIQGTLVVKKGKDNVVVQRSKSETIGHWFLKVAGVVEMLRHGFESKDIEIEKQFKRGRTTCRADIYAKKTVKRKEVEVWLECEQSPQLSSFSDKANKIRRVYQGRIIFLVYVEDFRNFVDSLYQKNGGENIKFEIRDAVPENTEIWAIYLGTLPRAVCGLRRKHNKIIMLEGYWNREKLFRKPIYDKIEKLTM